MDDTSIFIVGAKGQLGLALQAKYPGARSADISELDITDTASVSAYDWSGVATILNAAAYTNVDGAETDEGRRLAWSVNATGLRNLADVALSRNLRLVHISTDYVFDGSHANHTEDEPFTPLSVYGQTKAAGDIAASLVPQHYILRTSWIVGEGKNFVRTMLDLGQRGVNPSVVADQIGRLTFTSELVRAIDHLLSTAAPYGTYNVSNGGEIVSWANITRAIFELAGYRNTVTDTTTAEYFADKSGVAPRPLQSGLDLSKIESTGFAPRDWQEDLAAYIQKELAR